MTSERTALPSGIGTAAGTSPSVAAGPFLLAAAAMLGMLAVSSVSVTGQIAWGSIALAALCTGLVFLMSAITGYGGLGLVSWRLGPWSLMYGAVAFGVATLSWLSPQTGTAAEIMPSSVARALALTAVAFMLLTAGYWIGPYRLAAHYARQGMAAIHGHFTGEIRSAAVPWVLFAAGLAAQLAFAAVAGRFGYVGDVASSVSTASSYGQYLSLAGECVPLAVAAAAIRAYQVRTAGGWATLAIIFTGAVVAGSVAGNKSGYVVAVLGVIIPYARARRRLPVKTIVAAFLLFLLIVIPFNLAYRSAARGAATLTTSQAIAAAPSIAGQVLGADVSPSLLGQSASQLAQRIRAIDSPAIIMQRTPGQIPYADPVELITAPVADLVPRILWPGKPILTAGYQMSQEYFQLPPQVYTSTAITPEGDLYRHGGWLPLIAGMFLFGCGLRILDEVTDLRRSAHGALLIILLFPAIVAGGTDWSTMLAGIPGQVLLWLVVVTASFRRRSAPAALGRALPSARAARS